MNDNVTAITARTPPKPRAPRKIKAPANPFIDEGLPVGPIENVQGMLRFLAWHEMNHDGAPPDLMGELNNARYLLLAGLADALEHVNRELREEWKATHPKPTG